MNTDLVAQFLVYAVGSATLRLTASTIRKTTIGSIFAFLVCCAAAYSIGCGFEIGLLQATGVIPVEPWLLLTWTLLGITGFFIAETARPNGWVAMIPCCIVGVLMVLKGLTGDPFSSLRLGQYSLFVSNLSFAGGIMMILSSILAGLLVGNRREE